MQEMNIHQKKIEEELRNFCQDKGMKEVVDEEDLLHTERTEYRNAINMQVFGFKELVSDLKTNLELFGKMVKEGKKSEAYEQWESRKNAIWGLLEEIKMDFEEREEFLLQDFPVLENHKFEDPEKEDLFLANLPLDIPG